MDREMETLEISYSYLIEIEQYILPINVITFEVQSRVISQLKN